MAYLLDTNVLLRWLDTDAPNHPIAQAATAALRARGETLYITAQNVIEFWVVLTKPQDSNGFGKTPAETDTEVIKLMAFFPLLPESPAILEEWHRLVASASVCGRNVHDARLAAVARVYGENILTFNGDHFKRFGVTAIAPADVGHG